MEIDEAFRHALDGDAVLFLGAGFSLGAKNNSKIGEFPLANDLSLLLMTELGENELVPLQTASEIFMQRKGEVALLEYLNRQLGVKTVASHHELFAKPKWRRIWTTNYDAVIETAAEGIGKKIRPLPLTTFIPPSVNGEVDCVHINGFLPSVNIRNLNSSLVLSETSLVTNRFADSVWAALLRSDLEAARAVVFAGYSAADLDITRVLVAVESLQRKCVFLVGPNPTLASRTTINKFGRIAPFGGVKAASSLIRGIIETHKPQSRTVTFNSFVPLAATKNSGKPKAAEVFDLYVKGRVDLNLLAASATETVPTYALRRSEINDIASTFRAGRKAVVLLSRLGNGKTLLCEMIALKLRDQFDVYTFVKSTPSLEDEIGKLRNPTRPTLIVLEDYARHLELLQKLTLTANQNQYLLLSSRTPTHLTTRERLTAILGAEAAVEYRSDTLRNDELEELDFVLASAGLLGSTASWAPRKRIGELYQARGSGEFAGILLWLLESEPIRQKLADTFDELKRDPDAQRIVIAAMILTHISQSPDVDDIADFLGAAPINQIIFSESNVAADLVRYDRRNAYPRSGLFAVAALRALWNDGQVIEVLEKILRKAWELRSFNPRYKMIARDLMRYSKLRQIVPTSTPSQHVHDYYERIRNLPPCVNNELFWLQFALAEIEKKEFGLAERHLRQSYSIASRMKGYDMYQIDNVWALMLLLREVENEKSEQAFKSFVDASSIVARQMRERRHAYYPFRVASHYASFWRSHAINWVDAQKFLFVEACKNVYRALELVDPDLNSLDDIVRCRESIRKVLNEAGTVPGR